MRRILIAVGLLIGLVCTAQVSTAQAGTWSGSSAVGAAAENFSPIVRAGCGQSDFYCPAGLRRVCGPGGCRCIACGGGGYYEGGGGYGPGPGYGGYYRPHRGPNCYDGGCCPRGMTIQDGVCKPYRGG